VSVNRKEAQIEVLVRCDPSFYDNVKWTSKWNFSHTPLVYFNILSLFIFSMI